MSVKKKWVQGFYLVVFFLCIILLIHYFYQQYYHFKGNIFSTTYNIKALTNKPKKLLTAIEKRLKAVNLTFSTYDSVALVYQLNQGKVLPVNRDFIHVFLLAQSVSDATEGAFDITVAPLVDAWGFGHTKPAEINQLLIDSLKQQVGYKKLKLSGNQLIKSDAHIQIDFSAIAKGYGVDAVCQILNNFNVGHYMVEIGGEVRTKGKNPSGKDWHIGIEIPNIKNKFSDSLHVISITNRAIATSGNYRNFYMKEGIQYAHTIDPYTGKPIQHSILSASVVTSTCAEADAFATAFMVSGIEKSKKILRQNPHLEAYLIYYDSSNRRLAIYQTENLHR